MHRTGVLGEASGLCCIPFVDISEVVADLAEGSRGSAGIAATKDREVVGEATEAAVRPHRGLNHGGLLSPGLSSPPWLIKHSRPLGFKVKK